MRRFEIFNQDVFCARWLASGLIALMLTAGCSSGSSKRPVDASDASTTSPDAATSNASPSDTSTSDTSAPDTPTPDTSTPDADTPPTDTDAPFEQGPGCDVVLASWATEAPTPEGGGDWQLTEVDSGIVHGKGGARAVADGNPQTNLETTVGDSIILQLDKPLRVGGLQYQGGFGGAITDFELYAGASADCFFSEPIATGTFDLVNGGLTPITFEPTWAAALRLVVRGSSDASGQVLVTELKIHAGGRFDTTPAAYTTPGGVYRYHPRALLPSASAPRYELVQGPIGMEINGDTLEWTPNFFQSGTKRVVIRAESHPSMITQEFDLHVASVAEVAGTFFDATAGGTLTVADSGTALDGLTVTAPPDPTGSGAVWLRIGRLDGELPPLDETMAAAGDPFMILAEGDYQGEFDIDLPAPPPGTVPAGTTADDLLLAGYVADPSNSFPHDTVQGFSPRNAVSTLDLPMLQPVHSYTEEYLQNELGLVYFFDLPPNYPAGEPVSEEERAEVRPHMVELAGYLAYSRDKLTEFGCGPVPEQGLPPLHVYIRPPSDSFVSPYTGEMTLARDLIDNIRAGALARPKNTAAHEMTHVFQRFAIEGKVRHSNPFAWVLDPQSRWIREGGADFVADEIYDNDHYFTALGGQTGGLWTRENTLNELSYGLKEPIHYQKVAFFKSLKVRRPDFDICAFFERRASSRSGIEALEDALGGQDAVTDAFAHFVAGYNAVREGDLFDDHDKFDDLPPFVDRTLLGDTATVLFEGAVLGGGRTTEVISMLSEPKTCTLEVNRPSGSHIVLVHGADGELRAKLDSGKKEEFDLAPDESVFVTFAMAQSDEPNARYLEMALTCETCAQDRCGECASADGCVWCESSGSCQPESMGSCQSTVVHPSGCEDAHDPPVCIDLDDHVGFWALVGCVLNSPPYNEPAIIEGVDLCEDSEDAFVLQIRQNHNDRVLAWGWEAGDARWPWIGLGQGYTCHDCRDYLPGCDGTCMGCPSTNSCSNDEAACAYSVPLHASSRNIYSGAPGQLWLCDSRLCKLYEQVSTPENFEGDL